MKSVLYKPQRTRENREKKHDHVNGSIRLGQTHNLLVLQIRLEVDFLHIPLNPVIQCTVAVDLDLNFKLDASGRDRHVRLVIRPAAVRIPPTGWLEGFE